MFGHYANIIEELRGEPLLPVDEQIVRARTIVYGKSQHELDGMIAGLGEHRTVQSGGSAALQLYASAETVASAAKRDRRARLTGALDQ